MGMILSRFAESVADFDEEIPRLSLLRFLFPKRCTIRKIRRNILFPSIRYMIYYIILYYIIRLVVIYGMPVVEYFRERPILVWSAIEIKI